MPTKILHIDSSMRHEGSRSRKLSMALVHQITEMHRDVETTTRDLSDGISIIDANWIEVNFTSPGERTSEQRAVLAYSDGLFYELKAADVLVLGTAIYITSGFQQPLKLGLIWLYEHNKPLLKCPKLS